MAIITISRQLAALGDETAKELTTQLGYRLIDKANLDDTMEKRGLSRARYEKYDEKKPGFWASLSKDRDDYIHHLRSAILEELAENNVIIVGRGANAIFKGLPNLLPVRLVASYPVRMERIRNYYHCDEKRAKNIITRSDNDRIGFHRYFFDMDVNDASNYLAVLNMSHMHPATAANQIKHLCQALITEEQEAKAGPLIASMFLSQKVVDKILYEEKVPIHFLEANTANAEVVLLGVANSQSSIESAIACARTVPGVAKVTSEIQLVQEYSVMP